MLGDMSDLDKTDLLTIGILADHVRQRPWNSAMISDAAVTEARAIYERHLGELASPAVMMAMISEARGE
jgi:hypothetical protein